MATERQSPDILITQTNLNGTISDIQDDPNSPDGNWLVPIDNGTDIVCRVSFPIPIGNPTQGAGLQQFQIWVKRVFSGTPKTPTVRIELRETGGGVALSTPLANTNVTDDSGILLNGTWDANLLTNANGSAVECYIYGTKNSAGSNKSTIGVGAVEWNVTYTGEAQQFYQGVGGAISFSSNQIQHGVFIINIGTVDVDYIKKGRVQ